MDVAGNEPDKIDPENQLIIDQLTKLIQENENVENEEGEEDENESPITTVQLNSFHLARIHFPDMNYDDIPLEMINALYQAHTCMYLVNKTVSSQVYRMTCKMPATYIIQGWKHAQRVSTLKANVCNVHVENIATEYLRVADGIEIARLQYNEQTNTQEESAEVRSLPQNNL